MHYSTQLDNSWTVREEEEQLDSEGGRGRHTLRTGPAWRLLRACHLSSTASSLSSMTTTCTHLGAVLLCCAASWLNLKSRVPAMVAPNWRRPSRGGCKATLTRGCSPTLQSSFPAQNSLTAFSTTSYATLVTAKLLDCRSGGRSCECRAGFDQDLHTADKSVVFTTIIVHVVRLVHTYLGIFDCALLFRVGWLCTSETGGVRLKKKKNE